MAHYLLSAEATFSAAHTLPDVEMCGRLHGHNWRVRLTVRVEEDSLSKTGMGVDFRVIEDIAKSAVADFEHQYLNDLEPFKGYTPSAERIAKVIFGGARDRLIATGQNAAIDQIEVWEMPQYRVVYRP